MTKTVSQLLHDTALKYPNQTALIVQKTKKSFSFQQLHTLTQQTASWFSQKHNLQPNHTALVLIKPGLELICTVFALIQLGITPIIIDPGMGRKNFLKCVQQSSPNYLIGNGLAQLISILFPKYFKSIQKRIWVHKNSLSNLPYNPSNAPCHNAQPDDLAAVAFTSGSTGTPKGVCYTHSIFNSQIKLLQQSFNILPGDIDLPMLPIFALFNPALAVTTVIPNMNPSRPAKVKPQNILSALTQYKITSSFGSPVLWQIIHDHANKQPLPHLKRILMAGCAVPPALLDQYNKWLPNTTVYTPYGATEALPLTLLSNKDPQLTTPGQGTCIGKPLPGIQIKLNPTNQQFNGYPVGEILAKGPVVTTSYYNLPKHTAASKTLDNFHKMGDLGYFDHNNNLFFLGRLAEQVNHPNLFTDPAESLMNTHPKVRRSALINSPRGPLLIVEPLPQHWPRLKASRFALIQELTSHLRSFDTLDPVVGVDLYQHFPVDVRHNAKIHRLTLTKLFNDRYL